MLISLLVIWSYNCNNAVKKKVAHMGLSIAQVFRSTLNVIPQWISKPRIRKPYKHRKTSSGAGRFAQNLRTCKKSHYDVQNCKSGIHNQRHSFKRHRSRYKPISTNILYNGLKVKGRKSYEYKVPSPRRQNWMLCAIIRPQDAIICKSIRFKLSLLYFKELDIDNNHLLTNSEYDDYSGINLPLQFAPNQVDSTIDPLDNVVLTEVVLRPTKKPRSVGICSDLNVPH